MHLDRLSTMKCVRQSLLHLLGSMFLLLLYTLKQALLLLLLQQAAYVRSVSLSPGSIAPRISSRAFRRSASFLCAVE